MKPLGSITISLFLILVLVGCEAEETPTDAPSGPQFSAVTATPLETPTPTQEPMPVLLQDVDLRQLYEESLANLARYDHLYKGKWFLVEGTVDFMSNYQVVVDAGYGERGYYGDVRAILTDLPHSDQIPLNSGDAIAARCQVGEVVGYGVHMKNCSLEPVILPTRSEFGPTPTPAESAALPAATEAMMASTATEAMMPRPTPTEAMMSEPTPTESMMPQPTATESAIGSTPTEAMMEPTATPA